MKNLFKLLGLLFIYISFTNSIYGQAGYIQPSPTSPDEEVTLFIDINQSQDGLQNNALSAMLDVMSDTTHVYLWAWNPSSPIAGNGEWTASNEAMRLNRIGPKLYSITFVPTEFFDIEGAELYASGISCLAKLKDGSPIDGFEGEPKTEDLYIPIVPKLCDEIICVFPEVRRADDFLSITYDNTQESYEGLQNMGGEDCYLWMAAKLLDGTNLIYIDEALVTSTPELQMTSIDDGTAETAGKFRITFIPEDLFAPMMTPEMTGIDYLICYILRPGFSYPPGPPNYYINLPILTCE